MKVECVVLNGFAEKSGFCRQILVASAICLSSSSEKPSHVSLRNFNPLSKRRRNGAGPALGQLGDAARGRADSIILGAKEFFSTRGERLRIGMRRLRCCRS